MPLVYGGDQSATNTGSIEMSDKRICNECGWHGKESEVYYAPNPFSDDDGERISGCPECRQVETMRVACVEAGCWKEATCGTNTSGGYKTVCGDHYRMYDEKHRRAIQEENAADFRGELPPNLG